MKKSTLLLLALLFRTALFAQNWSLVDTITGPARDEPNSFVINGKIYVGGGAVATGGGDNSFYQYDPATNVWTQKASLPDYLWAGQCFALNGKGYMVSGADDGGVVSAVYQYDPVLDQWNIKNNFPGPSRQDGWGFSIGDTGYIFGGYPGGSELNDLWAYNPNTDSWTQKASMPSNGRSSVKGFVINNIAYVGLGEYGSSSNYPTDMGAYNPATNTWSTIAPFPGHYRAGQSAFSIGNFGYVGLGGWLGGGVYTIMSDFYRYNPVSNSWVSAGNFPGPGRGNLVNQNVNNIVYVGSGINAGTFYTDWWRFVYQLSVSLLPSQTACIGSQVILNPLVSGGIPPYVYSWTSSGDSLSCYNCPNPSVTLSQNSTYILAVTDANNTLLYDTVTYTMSGTSNSIQVNLTNTNISCSDPIDTTTVTVTNGIAPLTFYWGDGNSSTGSATGIHTYQQPGTYIFTVSDSSGCVTSVLDSIQSFAVAISLAGAVPPICIYDSTGAIKVAASGGTPPYGYLWNTGATIDSITHLIAGDYSVTVTDAALCSTQFYYGLSPANDGWDYYVNLYPTEPNCTNNGSITASAYGGSAPYSYLWPNGNTTPVASGLGAGNYVVTVTDSVGCARKASALLYYNCASVISGYVFVDSNLNCNFDSAEYAIEYVYVTATSAATGNTYYGTTDWTGLYTIVVNDTGTYNLQVANYEENCSNYTMCGNSSQNITIAVLGDSSANNNFGAPYTTGFDLTIHPGWTSADPGFQKEYWVMPYSQANVPFTCTATVVFHYDSNLIYQYSLAPLPVVDTVAHTLTWQCNNVPWPSWDWYNTRFQSFFMVPTTLPLGYLLQSSYSITPKVGDCDSTNNFISIAETVIGSLDPNEKTVSPAGSMPETDSVLTYTIHFQNTGTDSTHFIIVVDTLSPSLNAASVKTIASSSPYSKFGVSGKGVLTWEFNPLRLVDSIRNPQGSKGFVSFQVKRNMNIPIGTSITNTATIYFDYNSGVVTNRVGDTITPVVPNAIPFIKTVSSVSVKAFPNPFANFTNIQVTGLNEKYDFEVYDVTGRLMKRMPSVQATEFVLDRNELSSGMYLYRVVVNNKQVAYGKLAVE